MNQRLPALTLFLLLALTACNTKPPVTVPAELNEVVQYLTSQPHGPVVTLTDTGAAAVKQAGHTPLQDDKTQAWLLARNADALLAGMTAAHADYLLTTEPDLHDAPQLPKDKAVILPSLLTHLITLYGTGTRDQACVNQLQLVAASSAIRNVGGRHLPAALLWKRVPGAEVVGHKLVGGIPVRLETTRLISGQVFVFDCQTRADAKGDLTMRFPYAALPDRPIKMWTAMSKAGDAVAVTAEHVAAGGVVDVTQ